MKFLAEAGDVTIPLGYVVSVVGALWLAFLGAILARDKERNQWFEKLGASTAAITALNNTLERLLERGITPKDPKP